MSSENRFLRSGVQDPRQREAFAVALGLATTLSCGGCAANPPTASVPQNAVVEASSAPSPPEEPSGELASSPEGEPRFSVRLQDLERMIEEQREQKRRAEIRAQLLADQAVPDGAVLEVAVQDLVTSAFVVTGVSVWVDSRLVYLRTAEGGLFLQDRTLTAYTSFVPPGTHTIRVDVSLAGNASPLPYLHAYRLRASSECRLVVIDGHRTRVTAEASEQGGLTRPFQQRPAILWSSRYWERPGST
jgi:hypothetical protein